MDTKIAYKYILFLYMILCTLNSPSIAQSSKVLKDGNKKMLKHDYQGAMKEYDKVIEKYPDYAETYAHRALAKFKLDDQQGALEDVNKAIAFDSNFYTAYTIRAQFNTAFKYFKEAVADYTKCIQ